MAVNLNPVLEFACMLAAVTPDRSLTAWAPSPHMLGMESTLKRVRRSRGLTTAALGAVEIILTTTPYWGYRFPLFAV